MRRGFTLIQISILLTIASLVMVAVLPSSQTKLNADNLTTAKMNTILVALRQYEAANHSLPCPASPTAVIGAAGYGVAATNNGTGAGNNCSNAAPLTDSTNNVAVGMVPVRTLGLSNDYALDAYGRYIDYVVDTDATQTCWTSSYLPGTITVTDNGGPVNTVAALVSHGADGYGAWIPLTGNSATGGRLNSGSTDASQNTNAHVNSPTNFTNTASLNTLVKKNATSRFDDLVVYKNPNWNLNTTPVGTGANTSSPQVTISSAASGIYILGQAITFTATFPQTVTVTGTPYLNLTIGGSAGAGQAYYTGGSGTSTLTFTYTPPYSTAGGSAPIQAISPIQTPNGATITSGGCSYYAFTNYTSTAYLSSPGGVAVDGSSLCSSWAPGSNAYRAGECMYIVDPVNNLVEQWGAYTSYNNTQFYNSILTGQTFKNPGGAATDSSNNLYIADTGNGRILKWNAGASTYIGAIKSFSSIGGCGSCVPAQASQPLSLSYPMAVAVDDSTNCGGGNCIWIADTGNSRIVRCPISGFSASGANVANCDVPIPTANTSSSQPYAGAALVTPTGIAINDTFTGHYGPSGYSSTPSPPACNFKTSSHLNSPCIFVVDNGTQRVLSFQSPTTSSATGASGASANLYVYAGTPSPNSYSYSSTAFYGCYGATQNGTSCALAGTMYSSSTANLFINPIGIAAWVKSTNLYVDVTDAGSVSASGAPGYGSNIIQFTTAPATYYAFGSDGVTSTPATTGWTTSSSISTSGSGGTRNATTFPVNTPTALAIDLANGNNDVLEALDLNNYRVINYYLNSSSYNQSAYACPANASNGDGTTPTVKQNSCQISDVTGTCINTTNSGQSPYYPTQASYTSSSSYAPGLLGCPYTSSSYTSR